MKNKQTDHERIKIVFSAVEGSKTQEKIFKLDKLLNDPQNKSALNSMYFLSNDQYMNILHYLAQSDHCNIILPVIKTHIDSSLYRQQDHEGETPLKSAISGGRLENAKVLVDAQRIALKEKGFGKSQVDKEISDTVNIQDNKGGTALHRAAHAHRPEYIKFLLSIGADSSILNNEGKSAVIEAAEEHDGDNRMIKTIACLLKESQELDTIKYNGKSLIGIIRNTQRISWGDFQERELRRECDSNKKICCTIL